MEVENPQAGSCAICFSSPIKPNVPMERVESLLSKSGMYLEYHVTCASPNLITRSQAQLRVANSKGEAVLAIARTQKRIIQSTGYGEQKVEEAARGVGEQKLEEAATWVGEQKVKESATEQKVEEAATGFGEQKVKESATEQKVEEAATGVGEQEVKEAATGCAEEKVAGREEAAAGCGEKVQEAATGCAEEKVAGKEEATDGIVTSHNVQLSRKLEKILERVHKTIEEHDKIANKYEALAREHMIYVSVGTSRRLAILDLLSLQVSIMDWYIKQVASKHPILNEKFRAANFLCIWWFHVNEMVYASDPSFNLHRYWQERLPYNPPSHLLAKPDPREKWNVQCTPESRFAAMEGFSFLCQAADNFLLYAGSAIADRLGQNKLQVSSGDQIVEVMTSGLLLDSMGFFVSVLRAHRNMYVHMLENLFEWPDSHVKGKKRQRAKGTSKDDSDKKRRTEKDTLQAHKEEETNQGFAFPINMKVVSKVMEFLVDILGSLDTLDDDLKTVRMNIRWIAGALLEKCKDAVKKA